MNQGTQCGAVTSGISSLSQWLYANSLGSPGNKLNGDARPGSSEAGCVSLAVHWRLNMELLLLCLLSLGSGGDISYFKGLCEGNGLGSSDKCEDL